MHRVRYKIKDHFFLILGANELTGMPTCLGKLRLEGVDVSLVWDESAVKLYDTVVDLLGRDVDDLLSLDSSA